MPSVMLVQIRAHDQLVPPVAEGGQDWGLKCQRNVLREAVISTGTAKEPTAEAGT